MPFRDYFSRQAKEYARYRPGYPPELFDFLASLLPERELAWDCGTGSGQAAVQLAQRFKQVIATDASQAQLEHAAHQAGIEYRVEPAEAPTIETGTVDLVTVGVAIHWFDFEPFYEQVRRVAKPGAVIAAWTYHYPDISPTVDRVIDLYTREVLAGYWPERIHYLFEHYTTIPFPFQPVLSPDFRMRSLWDLGDLAGFIGSWSATQRFLAREGAQAMEEVWADLQRAWGDPAQSRLIDWPVYLRVGRVHPASGTRNRE